MGARHQKMDNIVVKAIKAYPFPHEDEDTGQTLTAYELSDAQQAAYVRGAYEVFDLTADEWVEKAKTIAKRLAPEEWEAHENLFLGQFEHNGHKLTPEALKLNPAMWESLNKANEVMLAIGYKEVDSESGQNEDRD